MQNLPKKIHVIGICGVATSALAIAFKKAGTYVSGSDKGFFPPVSTELEKHKVTFYAGWHVEKMIENGLPEAVIVGTASGSQNPETLYAKENNIPIYSFAEAIGRFFARENCLVCAGTWGKTSSTALLSFILKEAALDPSYMFGGISLSHPASAALTSSDWSIFEGDEYKSSPTDPTAKFFYYKAKHLLLTAVSWDHADLYPTEKDYFDTFKKLVSSLPSDGLIIANCDNAGVKKVLGSKKAVFYGQNSGDYIFKEVKQSENGLDFIINHHSDSWHIYSPMLGSFQAENITACFAMAHSLGLKAETIISAIAKFRGLKRRLEKRLDGKVIVIDDIAHSPEKAISVISTLKNIYKGKIWVVFEPNIGGRERSSATKYDHAFEKADAVIIPRLTSLKTSAEKEKPMDGEELAKIISQSHTNVYHIDDDAKLVNFLKSSAKDGDVIAFLGSHGFRGMIEEVVNLFS